MASRRLRRWLWLAVNGQVGLERPRIDPADRRILWIHSGMPQVGDSLMDLACRELFAGRGHSVDLLIDPHLVALYTEDALFANVFGDSAAAAVHAYDLAIVLGSSSHNLQAKLGRFGRLPYVNLQRYYTGPEFHRTLFGYFRLDQLLGGVMAEPGIRARARPRMNGTRAAGDAVAALGLPARFVALAVGGVRGFRTYAHWPEVVAGLRAAGVDETIVLIGAANGRAEADAIAADARATGVVDRVDRQSLPEAFEILRRCSVAACADGGLMHVAHAAEAPTVSLFAERIEPDYRLTAANRSLALYCPTEVSDIPPQRVVEAIASALRVPPTGVTVTRLGEP